MSFELYYTSAASGLKPGSKGFCTVAQTQGLPLVIAERLEALSGYRYAFEPSTPQAAHNPSAFTHYVLTAGSKTYHVVARIAPAGFDYSGRANKFAHHVVLDGNELSAGGPAWLAEQPNFLATQWSGEPRLLPAGPGVPNGEQGPGVCDYWQQVAGDAGWAGVLTKAFMADNQKPAYLIYPVGTDVLRLFVEAMTLLPRDQRWRVSFNTYFTDLPAGITCLWRGVLEGTPAASEARRQMARATVIDLTAKLGAPPAIVNIPGPVVTATGTADSTLDPTEDAEVYPDAGDDADTDTVTAPRAGVQKNLIRPTRRLGDLAPVVPTGTPDRTEYELAADDSRPRSGLSKMAGSATQMPHTRSNRGYVLAILGLVALTAVAVAVIVVKTKPQSVASGDKANVISVPSTSPQTSPPIKIEPIPPTTVPDELATAPTDNQQSTNPTLPSATAQSNTNPGSSIPSDVKTTDTNLPPKVEEPKEMVFTAHGKGTPYTTDSKLLDTIKSVDTYALKPAKGSYADMIDPKSCIYTLTSGESKIKPSLMEKPMSLEPKLHVGKNVVLPLPEKNTEFYKWLLENNPFTTDKGCRVKFTGGFSDVKDDVLELSPTSTSLALSKLFQYGKPVPDLDEKIKAGGTFTEIESKWIKGSDIKSHDDAIKKDSCYLEVKLTNRLVKGIDNNGSVLHVYLSSDEGDSLKYINPGEFWPGLAGKRKASLENQKSNNDSNRLNGQRISAIDEILSKNSKIEEKEREKKDKNADVDNINDQIKKMEAELLKLRCAVGECSNPVKRGPVLRNYVVDGGGNFSSDIKKEYETKKKNCEEENISLVARNQELAAYDAWIGKVEALDGDLCIVAFMAEKNKELATINIKIKRQN